MEVNPNYQSGAYPAAMEAVYRDFFSRYLALHGKGENLRDDKLIIGLGHSDAMQSLPQEPNTFVPQAPVGYTDKHHAQVLIGDMKVCRRERLGRTPSLSFSALPAAFRPF